MIEQITYSTTLFVFIFSILFLCKQCYGIYKAIKTNGEEPYIQGKYTALETGLSIAYILTYLIC